MANRNRETHFGRRIQSRWRLARGGKHNKWGTAVIKALGAIITAGLVAVVSGYFSVGAAQNRTNEVAAPPSATIVAKSFSKPLTARCVTLSGTAGFKTGWELWAGAHSANYRGGRVTVTHIIPIDNHRWQVSLNLGDLPFGRSQLIAVDFFYVDSITANSLRGVPDGQLLATPANVGAVSRTYELNNDTDPAPCN